MYTCNKHGTITEYNNPHNCDVYYNTILIAKIYYSISMKYNFLSIKQFIISRIPQNYGTIYYNTN